MGRYTFACWKFHYFGTRKWAQSDGTLVHETIDVQFNERIWSEQTSGKWEKVRNVILERNNCLVWMSSFVPYLYYQQWFKLYIVAVVHRMQKIEIHLLNCAPDKFFFFFCSNLLLPIIVAKYQNLNTFRRPHSVVHHQIKSKSVISLIHIQIPCV